MGGDRLNTRFELSMIRNAFSRHGFKQAPRSLGVMLLVMAALLLLAPLAEVGAQEDAPRVYVMNLQGALNRSMLEYLKRGIEVAERNSAELVVLQLDTPGGELSLMNAMVQEIRASEVPVVVYVAPRGAIAGSAGTVITLAGHAAAMAPETAIGAASPVGGQGEDLGETIAAKQKNITKATVRSLAAQRGEAAIQLAEATIETAEAASAEEALKVGLIDFISGDLDELLSQLDGFPVETSAGERVIHTSGARVEQLNITLIEEILGILTNPNIVFLLITVGVQAILIEISSPGGWVAGFIGVVALALATYGLGILPVNWFGLIFLATAFVLFILDIKAPTHGALTAAGVASLIVGALVLFNSPGTPDFQRVSIPLVVGTSLATAAIFFTVVGFGLRAMRMPIRTGQEALRGRTGLTRTAIGANAAGTVQLGGEAWSAYLAEGEEPIPPNTRVQVVRSEGVRLYVRKLEEPGFGVSA